MSGKWVPFELAWYDTRIFNCSFCGIMMAREYWVDDEFSGEMFCEDKCADVKRRVRAEFAEAKAAGRVEEATHGEEAGDV